MPVVKTVAIRLFTTGAEDAKLKIDRVSKAANELSRMDPKIRVQVDTAAAMTKLQLLRAELRRAAMGDVSAGAGAGGPAGAAGTGLFANPWVLGGAIAGGTALLPAVVPPIGAGLGLGVFGAFAALSGALKKNFADLTKFFASTAARMSPIIVQAFGPVMRLAKDLFVFLSPLVSAGGKILDAFVKPLDALVRSPAFSQFIAMMSRVGVQFAKLFGPELAQILGAVLNLFKQLAPAGMALWKALGPLVTTLVVQLAGMLGKLLPPLARAWAGVFQAITPLIPALAKLLVPLLVPIAKLIEQLSPLVFKLASVITGQLIRALIPLAKAFTAQANALLPILPPLVRLTNIILPPLIRLFTGAMIFAINLFAKALTALAGPIGWVVRTAVPWLQDAASDIAGFFRNLGPELLHLGSAAMHALWNGLKSTGSQLLSWAEGWLDTLQNILSAGLHILGGLFGGSSPGPKTGQAGANAALARRMVPAWSSGANWSAWNNVAMRESGWNNFAQNPTSGAYGIPQALPFTKMPKLAWPASAGGVSDPATQIRWMATYMQGRYGGPRGAWAHEQQFGWYDRGGWLQPGLTMALNTTGRPERVGMGAEIYINNLYVTAQDPSSLVRALEAYVKRNGRLRLGG